VVRAREEADYLDRELGGHYAFQTKLWQQAGFQGVCLQTIHRQQNDELLMSILNHLRYGELETCDLLIDGLKSPVNAIEALTRLCVTSTPLDHTPIYLCTTNRDAEALNQFHLGKLKGDAHVFRAVVRGRFPEGDQPTPETLSLKVGARVMTLTNKRTSDGEIEYVNGELGVVESIDDGNDAVVHVRLDRGDTVTIQRTKWSKYEYELEMDANSGRPIIRQHEVGTFVQIPLKLAYAVTIHKSQGLTLENVEVKLGNGCFASGQLYTALSRCRSIRNLRIDRPICLADAVIDHAVIDFYREIDSPQQVKGKSTAVTKSTPATDEDVVRTDLMQQHRDHEKSGTKRRAMPQEDTDKPKTRKPSISSEPDSVKEAKSQKITSSPDIDHLLVVYRNQNDDERHNRMTKRLNGIGFNKMDAPMLTELAEKFLDEGYLTESELETVHRLIAKYRRQWA